MEPTAPFPGPPGPNPKLEQLVFELLERLEDGETDALELLCAAHPEQADQLRARLILLRLMGAL
jgi:hypothetical protein